MKMTIFFLSIVCLYLTEYVFPELFRKIPQNVPEGVSAFPGAPFNSVRFHGCDSSSPEHEEVAVKTVQRWQELLV